MGSLAKNFRPRTEGRRTHFQNVAQQTRGLPPDLVKISNSYAQFHLHQMSSPPPSISNLQNADMAENDTPGTTPPVPVSATATPIPEVVMADPEESQPTHSEDPEEDEEEEESLSLPLSKIKRIFKMDPDYLAASQSAVYATGIATELFIQYFVEHASVLAKMDKRKRILYKDFSNAVAGQDSLRFLSDTVPRTQQLGLLIQQNKVNLIDETGVPEYRAPEEPENTQHNAPKTHIPPVLPKGQQTLTFVQQNEPKKAPINNLVSGSGNHDDAIILD